MDKTQEALKKALELAREALENSRSLEPVDVQWVKGKRHAAITAIKEALAEQFCDNHCTWLDHHPECYKAEQPAQQQEPVGVVGTDIGGTHLMYGTKYVGTTPDKKTAIFFKDVPVGSPLYTSPQPSKPWVGLTEEEVDECYYWKGRQWTTDELVRHVEAKLREKNNG